MTYSEFINSLSYGFSLFINTFYSVAYNLIHNYIFITLLGCIIFCSLVLFLFDIFQDSINTKIDNCDDYLKKKNKKINKIDKNDVVTYPKTQLASKGELHNEK